MNFNVSFNVLLSKYIVHPFVKIKKTLIVCRVIQMEARCCQSFQIPEGFAALIYINNVIPVL